MPESGNKPHGAIRPLNHGVTTLPENGSFKNQLTAVLENRWFDMFVMFLVFCDLVAVVMEMCTDHTLLCVGGVRVEMSPQNAAAQLLRVDASHAEEGSFLSTPRKAFLDYPQVSEASIIQTDSQQKVMNPTSLSLPRVRRPLRGSLQTIDLHKKPSKSKSPALLQEDGEEEGAAWICESNEGEKTKLIQSICHYSSIGILVLFFLEQVMKVYVAGKHYFENGYHVLDFVVITVSLVLDAFLTPMLESYGWDATTYDSLMCLLVLLRFWRIVRIIHGVEEIMTAHEEALLKTISELQEELERKR